MLTKKNIFKQAIKKLELNRLKSETLKTEHLRAIATICPEIETLIEKRQQNTMKLLKIIFSNKVNNKNKIILKIQTFNTKIQQQIQNLLKTNNLPENFLDSVPKCKFCYDYGFVKNEQCICLKKLIRKLTVKEIQKNCCFNLTKFSDFNLNFYSKNKNNNSEISDFEQMTAIFNICKKFTFKFPKVNGGLIMFGLTGLGKTHLSLSIANELIAKGFSVIYERSSEIIRKVTNEFFNHEPNNNVNFLNLIKEVDLLILDDLGSEFESNLNITAIFEILNIRTSLKKPIILNTNLTPEQLEKRYGMRIFSRISAELITLHFVGNDNRHKINNQQNKIHQNKKLVEARGIEPLSEN